MTSTMRTRSPRNYRCADCGATAPLSADVEQLDAAHNLTHTTGCATGRALREVIAADVAWLRAHPFAPHRWRAAELPELGELAAVGFDVTAGRWRVYVRRHPDGLARMICTDRRPALWVIDDVEVAA